jgi:hypothetical protein
MVQGVSLLPLTLFPSVGSHQGYDCLNPSARPPFDTLLHSVRGTVFPEVFYSFLHGYVSSINELPTTTLSVPVTTTVPPQRS